MNTFVTNGDETAAIDGAAGIIAQAVREAANLPPLGTSPNATPGVDPHAAFAVPQSRRQIWRAPEIERIARAIMREHGPRFDSVSNFRGAFFWQAKGGETGGRPNYGSVKLLTGAAREATKRRDDDESGVDYVMTVSADWIDAFEMTNRQVEALVHSLLCHLYVNKTGRLALDPPDLVAHRENVIAYGDWNAGLQQARDAFSQLPLWGGE
jgi:hypothetical protein